VRLSFHQFRQIIEHFPFFLGAIGNVLRRQIEIEFLFFGLLLFNLASFGIVSRPGKKLGEEFFRN
jgi:hypothetical protein